MSPRARELQQNQQNASAGRGDGPMKTISEGSREHDPLSSGSYYDDDDDDDSGNDDWDHGMVVVSSNENLSPNNKYGAGGRGRGRKPNNHHSKPDYSNNNYKAQQSSPRGRIPRDPEEEHGPVMSDKSSFDHHGGGNHDDNMSITSALMEASAAVFQYLTNADVDNESGYTLSDDSSIADRSAAVFDHLQQEAMLGNEEPMIQFLETAQVVSDVVLQEQFGREPQTYLIPQNVDGGFGGEAREAVDPDENSVSQQRAAIFQALARSNDKHNKQQKHHQQHQDVEGTTRGRRPQPMMQWLEMKPVDDDAESVVSEMSQTIFKVLDHTFQEDTVADFSAAVHNLLEDGKKNRKKQSNKSKSSRDFDENDSVSEHSAAIFKILDGSPAPAVSVRGNSSSRSKKSSRSDISGLVPPPSLPTDQSYATHLKPRTDPTKLMQRNIFHILAQRSISNKTPVQVAPIQEAEDEDEEQRDEQEVHEIIQIEDVTDMEEPSLSGQVEQPEQIDVIHLEEAEDGLLEKEESSPPKPPTDGRLQLDLSPPKEETQAPVEIPKKKTSKYYLPPLGLACADENDAASPKAETPKPSKYYMPLGLACTEEQPQLVTSSPPPAAVPNNHNNNNNRPLLSCFAPIEEAPVPAGGGGASVVSGMTEPPVRMYSEVIHADSSDQEEQEIQDEIDLHFVERFDHAFDEFIGQNRRFLMSHPNLVHNLRIAKLQKLLAHMDQYERDMSTQLSQLKSEKEIMITEYQMDLREASREKAARQISLQDELTAVNQKTLFKQAQFTWKIVNSSEANTKKRYLFQQKQKKKRDNFLRDNLSGVPTREELLLLLPSDEEGIRIKAAISAERRFFTYNTNEEEHTAVEHLRNFQVDNAFMTSEVAVLQKKLTHVEAHAKRVAWVDSILLRMDKVQMAKLKKKFTNKLGVVSLD
jgi:hypothetical protein